MIVPEHVSRLIRNNKLLLAEILRDNSGCTLDRIRSLLGTTDTRNLQAILNSMVADKLVSWDGDYYTLIQEPDDKMVLECSLWRHTNGVIYRVLHIANTTSQDLDKYPITVVYQGLYNEKIWTRPLSDWHRSFTKKV